MNSTNFLCVTDLHYRDISHVLSRAHEIKNGTQSHALQNKSIALLFEKPSLRTRASFEVGINELGGHSFYLGPEEVGLGKREPVADVSKVISRYVDCIIARVFDHSSLDELAAHSSKPVINALSDWEHPCQTLADLQTIEEYKEGLKGVTITYIGDGNNVARSLCLGSSAVGANFTIASPPGYMLDDSTLDAANSVARQQGATVTIVRDPRQAVVGADVVYTDVWTSMGQDSESEIRRAAFQGYQVNEDILSVAKHDAIFMHPMPAHYGEEVSNGMLDHSQSVTLAQAENRLHAQKALLEFVLSGQNG